ncbi:MAG: NAD(P)/FAD-dependent oxidoreductase [Deltaproteobacteria bacterium]|nr:NAD(P)/FAD-dependent oxidoreductase [Deltaproteobacteria bacterium]
MARVALEPRIRDLVVAGGGPAGLAVAIAAASRGLDVLVLERGTLPADKACGEGLLPGGVRALEALGALRLVPADDQAPIRAIRWIDEEGTTAEARFAGEGGLGVRRTALSQALLGRARAAGAEVRERTPVVSHRRGPKGVEVGTPSAIERARLLVAADGLLSPIRVREGLDRPLSGEERFGLRRHYALRPWTDAVEVHFADGVEAYVTPAGRQRVGVAFLCEEACRAPFGQLLSLFPAVRARLGGAAFDSAPAGAGPFGRESTARTRDRLVLVGDAAGYVDAITGEGISMALESALDLGAILPEALAQGATRKALLPFDRAQGRRWRKYAAAARFVLGLARRPEARRRVLEAAGRHPRVLSRLVSWAVG